MASTTTRGRPPVLEKVDLKLADGTAVTMSLVGEGDTLQLVLPAQWNIEAFSRSITTQGGRTKMTFVAAAVPKAAPAPRAKKAASASAAPAAGAGTDTASLEAPKRKRGRARKTTEGSDA
jgi:hypothetical protein